MTEQERLLEAAEGREDLLIHARRQWTPQNTMRKILNIKADTIINSKRTMLETCSPADLSKIQGEISGIREMIGAINQQG